MNHVGEILDGQPTLHGHGGFMNEVRRMRTNNMDAKNFLGLFIRNHFKMSKRLTNGLCFSETGIFESPNRNRQPAFPGLGLSQSHTPDFR